MNDQQEENEETRENKEETEVLDFTKPDYIFLPPGHHTFRQQGYYLVCKSCEISHAVWIGADKIMVGENKKGQPIIKKRT